MGSPLSCVALEGTAKAEAVFEWPPNHYFAGRFTISADGKTRVAPVNNPPTGANIAIYEIGSSRPRFRPARSRSPAGDAALDETD
jgi:hypothetical protein